MNNYTLHFTKRFTAGTLKGLTVPDTLTVASEAAGAAAVEVYRDKVERNGYTVTDWYVASEADDAAEAAALAASKALVLERLQAILG